MYLRSWANSPMSEGIGDDEFRANHFNEPVRELESKILPVKQPHVLSHWNRTVSVRTQKSMQLTAPWAESPIPCAYISQAVFGLEHVITAGSMAYKMNRRVPQIRIPINAAGTNINFFSTVADTAARLFRVTKRRL